ncbi:Cell death protease [Blyttiomyces sp. JEL0837]|nr:Cell death protease [Blyttiomyces sp. JEL0837]
MDAMQKKTVHTAMIDQAASGDREVRRFGQEVPDCTASTKDDYAVKSLPGIPSSATTYLGNHYAGTVQINNVGDNMFFWYLDQAPNTTPSNKLVVWLNGGPGCSSLIGMFTENGPILIQNNSFIANPNSWNTQARVLYVDNPVGTGFSSLSVASHGPTEETQVSQTFVGFLNQFYTIFPEARSYDLYLTGESYAGRFIPFIASAILNSTTSTTAASSSGSAAATSGTIPLKGIALGSALLGNSQFNDSSAFRSFLSETALVPDKVLSLNDDFIKGCIGRISSSPFAAVNCYKAMTDSYISIAATKPSDFQWSVYNIQQNSSIVANAQSALEDLMNNANLQAAIHANTGSNTVTWAACTSSIASLQLTDDSSSIATIQSLLAANLPVVIFAGDQDFIINHFGIENQIASMNWNGATGFKNPSAPWTLTDGTQAGTVYSERGLSYILVKNAGHMIPKDAGHSSSDLLAKLLTLSPGAATLPMPASSGPSKAVIAGVVVVLILVVAVLGYLGYRNREKISKLVAGKKTAAGADGTVSSSLAAGAVAVAGDDKKENAAATTPATTTAATTDASKEYHQGDGMDVIDNSMFSTANVDAIAIAAHGGVNLSSSAATSPAARTVPAPPPSIGVPTSVVADQPSSATVPASPATPLAAASLSNAPIRMPSQSSLRSHVGVAAAPVVVVGGAAVSRSGSVSSHKSQRSVKAAVVPVVVPVTTPVEISASTPVVAAETAAETTATPTAEPSIPVYVATASAETSVVESKTVEVVESSAAVVSTEQVEEKTVEVVETATVVTEQQVQVQVVEEEKIVKEEEEEVVVAVVEAPAPASPVAPARKDSAEAVVIPERLGSAGVDGGEKDLPPPPPPKEE